MPAVAGVLGGCRVESSATGTFAPKTLTPAQNDLVATLGELIIPETDTPGARAARVNEFIDRMLTDWYAADDREQFLAGLATVDPKAQEVAGKPFMDLSADEQNQVLSAMEEEAAAWRTALQEGNGDPANPPFFNLIKQMTLFGYYTSEVGAAQELRVMPMGRYDGAVPYAEIGRAWS